MIVVTGSELVLANGQSFSRKDLSEAVMRENKALAYYRKKPSSLSITILVLSALWLYAFIRVDGFGAWSASWLIVLIGVVGASVSLYCLVSSYRTSLQRPYIELKAGELVLFATFDQDWAELMVEKLRQLAEHDQGCWCIDELHRHCMILPEP